MKKTREVLFNHRTKQRRYNGSEEVWSWICLKNIKTAKNDKKIKININNNIIIIIIINIKLILFKSEI
jgi:hypothetical protein